MAPCVPAWLAIGSMSGVRGVDMRRWLLRYWLIGRCSTLPGRNCIVWRSTCFPENERSRKVALKVGASYEGMRKAYMFVNGQWRDHESYALLPEYAPNGFTARLMGE